MGHTIRLCLILVPDCWDCSDRSAFLPPTDKHTDRDSAVRVGKEHDGLQDITGAEKKPPSRDTNVSSVGK